MKPALLETLKAVAASLLLCCGAGLVLWRIHTEYPIQHWMLWRYSLYWASSALFSVACLSCGFRLTRWLLPPLPSAEQLTISFAAGVFVFFWGTFVAGLLSLYGRFFAFAWPLAMTAVGAKATWAYMLRLARSRRIAWSPTQGATRWLRQVSTAANGALPVTTDTIVFAPGVPDVSLLPLSAWRTIWRTVGARLPPTAYGAPAGDPELRAALAGYLRRVRGVV